MKNITLSKDRETSERGSFRYSVFELDIGRIIPNEYRTTILHVTIKKLIDHKNA